MDRLGRQRLVAWLSLPDSDRAELLDGRIVYRAMASGPHGGADGVLPAPAADPR